MSESVATAPTIGAIALQHNVPVHRVEYVIRTRGIQPIAWAGNARIFSDADVAYIASELRRIDEERVSG